jgi:hypothetical protein
MPADSSHHGLGQQHARRPHGSVTLRVQAVATGFVVQSLEVSACAKRTVLAMQHGHSGIRVGIERAKRIGQLLGRHAVDRIARLGAVDGHDGDCALARDLNF